jgi:hypothetical protein
MLDDMKEPESSGAAELHTQSATLLQTQMPVACMVGDCSGSWMALETATRCRYGGGLQRRSG